MSGSERLPRDERPPVHLEHLLKLPDGRVVEWEAIGDGPPLLWIEGGPGLPAHLARPDVRLFADRFRAYLVNAPGCGRTTRPETEAGYSLEATTDFFAAVHAALGLGPVTVMGHSWGGLVALAFTVSHPDAVERLVVIDGYAGDASIPAAAAEAEREHAFDRIRDRAWFGAAIEAFESDAVLSGPELDERFGACWPLYFATPDGAVARSHVQRLTRESRWNVDAVEAWAPEPPINLLPALAKLDCPTLVMVGEDDFICGPAWNRPIAAAIPSAVYAEVPGVGHFPQYEAPDTVRRLVLDWIDGS